MNRWLTRWTSCGECMIYKHIFRCTNLPFLKDVFFLGKTCRVPSTYESISTAQYRTRQTKPEKESHPDKVIRFWYRFYQELKTSWHGIFTIPDVATSLSNQRHKTGRVFLGLLLPFSVADLSDGFYTWSFVHLGIMLWNGCRRLSHYIVSQCEHICGFVSIYDHG